MAIATVTTEAPLKITFTGDLEETPVAWKPDGVSLAEEDHVDAYVDVFSRKAIVTQKLEPA